MLRTLGPGQSSSGRLLRLRLLPARDGGQRSEDPDSRTDCRQRCQRLRIPPFEMAGLGADEVHHCLHERSFSYLVQKNSCCQQSQVNFGFFFNFNTNQQGLRLFGVLYNIAKPFLSERVKENIVFHG